MELYDEEERKNRRKANLSTSKKLIIAGIVLVMILVTIIITLLVYIKENPINTSVYVNGVRRDSLMSILNIQTDENGKTQIYIPIKAFAPFVGYIAYNGEYKRASEDMNVCYAITQQVENSEIKVKPEVVTFRLKSNLIYKLDLEGSNGAYDYCTADKAVFKSNGELYTSVDGAEQGFNIVFNYDEKNKTIKIFTLPYLANMYKNYLEQRNIGNFGLVTLEDKLSNIKAIFDGMLIVKTKNGKYGVISTTDYSIILEPKYDNINYVQYSKDFLITTNGKVGLMSKEGKTKISAIYDELTLMDRNSKLYKTRTSRTYGVINENQEIIIHPEYEAIGISIDKFLDNGIKNGYIILDNLIPVKQNNKWGFFNLEGDQITNFSYDDIGCQAKNTNNVYNLLEIPNYNIIVLSKDKKYGFMDANGNDKVLRYGFIFEEIFMRISSGEISYFMKYNQKDWDVIEYLQKEGIKPVNKEEEEK